MAIARGVPEALESGEYALRDLEGPGPLVLDSELFSDGSFPLLEVYLASFALRRSRPLVPSDHAGREELLGLQPAPGRDEFLMLGRYPHGVESRGPDERDGQETLGESRPSIASLVDNRNTTGEVGRNTSG